MASVWTSPCMFAVYDLADLEITLIDPPHGDIAHRALSLGLSIRREPRLQLLLPQW